MPSAGLPSVAASAWLILDVQAGHDVIAVTSCAQQWGEAPAEPSVPGSAEPPPPTPERNTITFPSVGREDIPARGKAQDGVGEVRVSAGPEIVKVDPLMVQVVPAPVLRVQAELGNVLIDTDQ